jgi:hypothetical protein
MPLVVSVMSQSWRNASTGWMAVARRTGASVASIAIPKTSAHAPDSHAHQRPAAETFSE